MTIDLGSVVKTLREHERLRAAIAIVIHGSYASGTATSASDVDVISIHEETVVSSDYFHAGGVEIDLFRVSRIDLERHLSKAPADNDSPLLRACIGGIVVTDVFSIMPSVKERASEIWSRGPTVPSGAIAHELRMHAMKLVRSLGKPLSRSNESQFALAFAWIRFHRVFFTLVMHYHILHGLWVQDLEKLILHAALIMPKFHLLCEGYLRATTLTEAMRALHLVEQACQSPELLDDGLVVGGVLR